MDFLTKTKFSSKVEETVRKKKLTYIDAVVHICEEHNIDPGSVKKFLNNIIRNKIEVEAQNLNLLPKEGNSLPI